MLERPGPGSVQQQQPGSVESSSIQLYPALAQPRVAGTRPGAGAADAQCRYWILVCCATVYSVDTVRCIVRYYVYNRVDTACRTE